MRRAKGVSNNVQVNQRLSADKLQQLLESVTARNKELEQELVKLRNAVGCGPGQGPISNAAAPAAQALQTVAAQGSAGKAVSDGTGRVAGGKGAVNDVGDGGKPAGEHGLGKSVPVSQVWLDVGTALAALLGVAAYFVWEDWSSGRLSVV